MKSVYVTIMVLFFSFQAGSIPSQNGHLTWVRIHDTTFESPLINMSDKTSVQVHLFYSKVVKLVIHEIQRDHRGIVMQCVSPKKETVTIHVVNGRSISFIRTCVSGEFHLIPKYKNQTKYIINEFLTKDYVQLSKATVPSLGFIEAYSEIIRYASYMN